MDNPWVSGGLFGSNRFDEGSRPVTVADLESYTKNIEKNKEVTDAEKAFGKQKTRGELFGSYKQQILSGVLDPLSASQSFKEEAKGFGGTAKRTQLATRLADLRPIPGYDPGDYAKRERAKQEKAAILARPETWQEKINKLTDRTGSIQEKIDALMGSKEYDATPNRQAEKDVLAQISSLQEEKASIDPSADAARIAKLEKKIAGFNPEKATAALDERLAKFDPDLRYKQATGTALSTQANLLGLGKGIVTPQLQKSLIQQAKAQGITASEMPSYMREQLSSSQITRPYLLKSEQEQREFDYGNIGRDKSGLITNTYQSVLSNNPALSASYGLKSGQGMSIGDIEHLKNIDMQNVVNSGMAKVENIRGMSSMLGLIGYALS